MTPESARAASFSVSIKPGMHNAKEARRAVVELFARYAGVIEVGEVQSYLFSYIVEYFGMFVGDVVFLGWVVAEME